MTSTSALLAVGSGTCTLCPRREHTPAGIHPGARTVRTCVMLDLRSIFRDTVGKNPYTAGAPIHAGAHLAGIFSNSGEKKIRLEAHLSTFVHLRGYLQRPLAEHVCTRALKPTAAGLLQTRTPGTSAIREEGGDGKLSHPTRPATHTSGPHFLGAVLYRSCI